MLKKEQGKEGLLTEDKKVMEFLYRCLLVLEKQKKEYHEPVVRMITKLDEILTISS